jgi:hypothetical protein
VIIDHQLIHRLVECMEALYRAVGWVDAGQHGRAARALDEASEHLQELRRKVDSPNADVETR